MHARRRDDVAAIASGIEARRDPAGGRWDRAAILEPEMPTAAAGDHRARWRQRAVLRLKRRQARRADVAINVQHPKPASVPVGMPMLRSA